jgi:hypothetical protein
MDRSDIGEEGVDKNNSGSCAMVGFGIEDADSRQGDGNVD